MALQCAAREEGGEGALVRPENTLNLLSVARAYYQQGSGGRDPGALQSMGNLAMQAQVFGADSPPYYPGPVCEPIPENPLVAYPFLIIAIDAGQLQELQDAAYRREHLRRGLAFNGPQGLFFAQAELESFLVPGTEYVAREELLAALMPAMVAAAWARADVEPYVAEIARNESARLYLEPLRNPLVNVELVDPEGKESAPTRLKFVVDFKEVRDDHGSIPLPSLDAISRSPYELIDAGAKVDARQLSEIAYFQARTEWMSEKYLKILPEMKDDPKEYAFLQVKGTYEFVVALSNDVNHLAQYLFRNNQDQAATVARLKAQANGLETAAKAALDVAEKLRVDEDPGSLTVGESWDQNADEIRKNRDEDWEEGGFGYVEAVGNEIGLVANKIVQGVGNIGTGFYMSTHAARTRAYRNGEISYNSYSGFSISDVAKGALMDVAAFAPGYGGKLGRAATGLFGLAKGTAAAFTVEGQAVGFVSGSATALANDASSSAAAWLAGSEDERMFQKGQIGGPWSWLTAGSEGSMFGGGFGLAGAAFPRPTALRGEPPRPAVPKPVEPAAIAEAAESTSKSASTSTPKAQGLPVGEATTVPQPTEIQVPEPATDVIAAKQRRAGFLANAAFWVRSRFGEPIMRGVRELNSEVMGEPTEVLGDPSRGPTLTPSRPAPNPPSTPAPQPYAVAPTPASVTAPPVATSNIALGYRPIIVLLSGQTSSPSSTAASATGTDPISTAIASTPSQLAGMPDITASAMGIDPISSQGTMRGAQPIGPALQPSAFPSTRSETTISAADLSDELLREVSRGAVDRVLISEAVVQAADDMDQSIR
jgi:hypothetical protein